MGFPRQEHWSELPCPSPGDLPHPGTGPRSPALAGGFFTTEPPGKPQILDTYLLIVTIFLTYVFQRRLSTASEACQAPVSTQGTRGAGTAAQAGSPELGAEGSGRLGALEGAQGQEVPDPGSGVPRRDFQLPPRRG